jgi:hypothetical protein
VTEDWNENCRIARAIPAFFCSMKIPFLGKLFGPRALSLPQRWVVAAGGILTGRNHDPFDRLTLSYGREPARKVLAQWWDAPDRAGTLQQLEWLKAEGHRKGLRDMLRGTKEFVSAPISSIGSVKLSFSKVEKFVMRHWEELDRSGLEAWDHCRIVCVARWGFVAGYFRERETWEWLMLAARAVRSHFSSWKDLGADYMLGYHYWAAATSMDDAETQKMTAAHELLLHDPNSPWRQLAWDIDPNLLRAD